MKYETRKKIEEAHSKALVAHESVHGHLGVFEQLRMLAERISRLEAERAPAGHNED